jgi:hypothetical protein
MTLIHFTRSARSNVGNISKAYWIAFTHMAQHANAINHIGVTTIEELEQSSIHPLKKHPKTDMPWQGIESIRSGKRIFSQRAS